MKGLTEVTVLRLGHRPRRDKRLTTHVCLTARAFGARRILLDAPDKTIVSTVEDVTERFGGPFDIEVREAWRKVIADHPGPSMHLTMYGQPHTEVVAELDSPEELLIVLGAEKVPREVYDLATYNVSVGNQPHSEVAALAAVMLEVLGPGPLTQKRTGAELRIEPSKRGKQVESAD